eukprot:3906362-Rhodomonas_salina.1
MCLEVPLSITAYMYSAVGSGENLAVNAYCVAMRPGLGTDGPGGRHKAGQVIIGDLSSSAT